MASLSIPRAGKKGPSIQWYSQGGERKTIYLGRVPVDWAREFHRHTCRLIENAEFGEPLSRKTSSWLSELSPKWRQKLADKGLAEALTVANLGELFDHCRERLVDAEGSQVNLDKFDIARANFFRRFQAKKPVHSVKPTDADDYADWLQKHGRQDGRGDRLASATANKQLSRVRGVFKRAVDKELIVRNPFDSVSIPEGEPDAQQYVPLDVIARVLDRCAPDLAVRVALARYAGLRHPSEVHALELEWVDLPARRMLVFSPKNVRYDHKAWREIPIDPLLVPYLEYAFESAGDGERFVAHHKRDICSTSWRNALERACKRAAVVPWVSLWHSLRGSRAIDLLNAGVPEHTVVDWQNTSAKALRKHYLRPTDDHFAQITGVRPDREGQAEPQVRASIAAQVARFGGRLTGV